MVRGWHLWQQVSRELAQWMGLTPRGSFQGTIEPGWQAGIPFSRFLESNCLESCATFSVQFWFTLLLLSPPEETSQFPLIPSPSSDTIHSAYRWSTLCCLQVYIFPEGVGDSGDFVRCIATIIWLVIAIPVSIIIHSQKYSSPACQEYWTNSKIWSFPLSPLSGSAIPPGHDHGLC